MSCDILLVAVNAGYAHTSLSIRCIAANLDKLHAKTQMLEVDSSMSPLQIVEKILEINPRIVAFSVYIWNVETVVPTIKILKTARNDIKLVAGGPQIIKGEDPAGLLPLLDSALCGEGEIAAPELFEKMLKDSEFPQFVEATLPDLTNVELPYKLYTDSDISTRMVYAEATRGCPFFCEYCTSSGSSGIRCFPLDKILPEFEKLLKRGVLQFKFLDRSFNFGGEHSLAVLDFFIKHKVPGLRLHFEFTPHDLNESWRTKLIKFDPEMLHLEVGIQTWDKTVAKRIRRPLDPDGAEKSLRFLVNDAKADVHADLIAGLPGETPESFVTGFDRLVRIAPSEIQVGILKKLPGTAIGKHDEEFSVKWSPVSPYQILENNTFSFEAMREMERFSRCWDMLYNRGRFRISAPMLWADGESPYSRVEKVTSLIYKETGRMHAISPKRIAKAVLHVLTRDCGFPEAEAMEALERDARESSWKRS
ncbi:MAG: DUF4080 domain-containing protein [Lentisphaerae bacterium]|jgi:radical SAM superfamily enzyme YgiQ (UPF0313 family)|nr:DUF4080 domain-containing protein [Lentisphaerota bacterium]